MEKEKLIVTTTSMYMSFLYMKKQIDNKYDFKNEWPYKFCFTLPLLSSSKWLCKKIYHLSTVSQSDSHKPIFPLQPVDQTKVLEGCKKEIPRLVQEIFSQV